MSSGIGLGVRASWLVAAVLVALQATPVIAIPADDALAAKVLPIFDIKCGQCHGPQAKKKEKFGYVTDLQRVAENAKFVVRGSSGKSKLWNQIEEGDMPPSDDERSIPLTSAEKVAIKAWIDAGAPAGTAISAAGTTNPVDTSMSAADDDGSGSPGKFAPLSLLMRVVRLTGRLHPLVAHFPIALLMAAAMAEAGWFFTRQVGFTSVVRFCVIIGGLGAIGAAILGWINAIFRHGDPVLLFRHRWLGTAAGIWVIPVILLCEVGIRRVGSREGMSGWSGKSRTIFEVVLLIGVTLIGVAAHIGGSLVYGENYFDL